MAGADPAPAPGLRPGPRSLVGARGLVALALLGTAATRAAAQSGCDNPCVIQGQSASCRDRVRYSMLHSFSGKAHACKASHRLAIAQCQEACAECSLEDIGCKDIEAEVSGCQQSCVLNGQSSTCSARVQYAAEHGKWGTGSKCAEAHGMVVKQCSSCSKCLAADTGCVEPRMTTPEPATTPSAGCGALCWAGGHAATCGARMQLAAIADFDNTPISCALAYGKVLDECPMCMVCPIGDTGCLTDGTTTSTSTTSTVTTSTSSSTTNTSTTATTVTTSATTVDYTTTTTSTWNWAQLALPVFGGKSPAEKLRPVFAGLIPPAVAKAAGKVDPFKKYEAGDEQPARRTPSIGRLPSFWMPALLGLAGCMILFGLIRLWTNDGSARRAVVPHMALAQHDTEPRAGRIAPLVAE